MENASITFVSTYHAFYNKQHDEGIVLNDVAYNIAHCLGLIDPEQDKWNEPAIDYLCDLLFFTNPDVLLYENEDHELYFVADDVLQKAEAYLERRNVMRVPLLTNVLNESKIAYALTNT